MVSNEPGTSALFIVEIVTHINVLIVAAPHCDPQRGGEIMGLNYWDMLQHCMSLIGAISLSLPNDTFAVRARHSKGTMRPPQFMTSHCTC